MADDFDRGRQVGKYEILTRLSVGGMAELYLAFLPGPGGFKKFVALKQILPDVRRDEQFVKMFLDEARITASLNHPNIGQVFDLGRDEKSGELFLAMEFIAGQDLGEVIKRAARGGVEFPIALSCRIVRDLCLGLHAAHTFVDPSGRAQPVIHRDVAPKNVMVSYAGHVKVIDFGIAKAKGRLIRTQTGQIRGTQSYMSPEQIQDLPIDGRSDLFSVGIVLHELLTGERLYPASSPASILRVIQQAPDDPRERNPAVPPELADVVLQALAKNPADRFQTGKAFARAIEMACPQLADDDALAAFMSQLFEAQLKSSRALFEAAQEDAGTHRLSGLVERLTVAEPPERSLATPLQRPSVLRQAPTAGQRLATAPWAFPAVIGGALLIIGLVIWNEMQAPEPAPQPGPTAATPITGGPLGAIQRGRAAMTSKDFLGAGKAFEEAVALEPTNWAAVYGSGVAARRMAHWPQARKRLEQAVNLARDPKDGSASAFDLACVQAQQGDLELAVANLQRAIGLVGVESFSSLLASDPDLDPLRQLPAFARLRGVPPTPTVDVEVTPPSPSKSPVVRLSATTLALMKEAQDEKSAKNYERAAMKLEKCVKLQPGAYPCYRLLGSTYAFMAGRDSSAVEMERARHAYQRFLEVAPRDDEYVPKVAAILEAAKP